jgi:hypothetical protein
MHHDSDHEYLLINLKIKRGQNGSNSPEKAEITAIILSPPPITDYSLFYTIPKLKIRRTGYICHIRILAQLFQKFMCD